MRTKGFVAGAENSSVAGGRGLGPRFGIENALQWEASRGCGGPWRVREQYKSAWGPWTSRTVDAGGQLQQLRSRSMLANGLTSVAACWQQ